jgi:diguanylate cyclase (GGDEF)-like protein
MILSIRRSLGRKLVIAVGAPSLLFALVVLLWLRAKTGMTDPGVDAAYRLAIVLVLLFAAGMAAIHAVAMRFLVEQPLQRLAAGLRRAREGDFLHRVPVETADELGVLAENFNTTLAAITDLHVRRIEDAASIEFMQRELALKAQVEARVKELTLLFDLSRRLVSTLELDRLLEIVTDLVGRGLGDHAFAIFLAEEGTGDLVVRSVSGLDAAVVGRRVRSGEGPAGWAAQERATVLVKDAAAEGRRPVLPWQPGAQADGTILAVPLLHQDACGGVLAFFRPARDAFPPDEVRLLESVAAQAAIAIDNARLHQKMVRLSATDALTGVHNRRSLFARLELEADRCERFDHAMAVALVDVDRFRSYNERNGHGAGDAILRRVAAVLQGCIRKIDLVARYGGEEFAVLLPRADRPAALAAAEKLRAAVKAAGLPDGDGPPVTISIGIGVWPDDARDVAALMDAADAALYAAKRAGRDAVRAHEPGMREHPGRRRDVHAAADVEAEGG